MAAKITHKAQAVTSLAAKWHACATIDSFDDINGETPRYPIASPWPEYPDTCSWDVDEEGDGDDELDNTNLVPIYANTISYQKRQALGEILVCITLFSCIGVLLIINDYLQ